VTVGIKAEPSFSLKDQFFNAKSVGTLASALHVANPGFPQQRFERKVLKQFPALELKERIHCIVETLEDFLPEDFAAATKILLRALPAPLDPDKTDDDFGTFIWVVPGEYVAKHGCTAGNLDLSLQFLREATKRFSSEGAIRPFLREFPLQTMAFVRECSKDGNYHVRRLASEGIRPYLPWAERVVLPLDEIIAVLAVLHSDQTRYVTRSVANTMNDISKIDGDLVVRTLKRWRRLKQQEETELMWMTRHSLRTLLKDSHIGTLDMLGYSSTPRYRISELEATAEVKVGGEFLWRCTFTSLEDQKLKVLLRIYFLKANGRHSSKLFAVKDASFGKGNSIQIVKRQAFKPITTRVLYPGRHFAELVVNGVARRKCSFELIA
jgi:3-methyladenine DNA glycosylase AlkC